MTRSYRLPRPRRVTQPIVVIRTRPRDPTIRTLGFERFRLFRNSGSPGFTAVTFTDRTNAMSAFANLGRV